MTAMGFRPLRRLARARVFCVQQSSGKSRGAELEFQAAAGHGLEFGLSAAYLKSDYTNFANAQFCTPVLAPATPRAAPSPTGGNTVSVGDATGRELVSAPPVSADARVTHILLTAVGEFSSALSSCIAAAFISTRKIAWDSQLMPI